MVYFNNQNELRECLKTTVSPDGSKELLLEVEGVVPKAASKLGCSRLFWAGVTGVGEGAMKEPPNPRKKFQKTYKQKQLNISKGHKNRVRKGYRRLKGIERM